METNILNYRILVEKEGTPRKKRAVYVAYCPKLGISDWGASIDDALIRIGNGTYGYCTTCQEMIDTDRLSVLPMATLCKSCEEKKKKK